MNEAEIAMKHGGEFRRCLVESDLDGMVAIWAHVAPHLACMSRPEALVTFHMARVGAKSVPLHLRQYSDRWLTERKYHSTLPEHMKHRRRLAFMGH